jgi:hypothetical protein
VTAPVTPTYIDLLVDQALALADALEANDCTGRITEREWELAASITKIPLPGSEVRTAVVAVLRERAGRRGR